jgi:hypothetical protein
MRTYSLQQDNQGQYLILDYTETGIPPELPAPTVVFVSSDRREAVQALSNLYGYTHQVSKRHVAFSDVDPLDTRWGIIAR